MHKRGINSINRKNIEISMESRFKLGSGIKKQFYTFFTHFIVHSIELSNPIKSPKRDNKHVQSLVRSLHIEVDIHYCMT